MLVRFVLLMMFSLNTFAIMVNDIRVEGLEVLPLETVETSIPINIGTDVSKTQVGRAIQRMYASGYFDDIKAYYDYGRRTLIFRVKERPLISSVKFDGSSLIEEKQLKQMLESIGLIEGQVYKRNLLILAQRELEKVYDAQGRYGTKFSYDIKEHKKSVDILVKIEETEVVVVKDIFFIGNQFYSDADLYSVLSTKKDQSIKSLTGSSKYNREKLQSDMEKLRLHYLDTGFLDFEIVENEIKLSPNLKDIYVIITIKEGDRYKISGYNINGNHDQDIKMVDETLALTIGAWYNETLIQEKIKSVKTHLSNLGYLNTKVVPQTKANRVDKTVVVNYTIDTGKKFFVNRITFEGNTTTKDNVLRREVVQQEGTLASMAAIEQSKANMARLGYFESVNYEIKHLEEKPGWIDIVFKIVERSTATISGNLSYSSVYKTSLGLNYSHNNVLGTGDNVSINADVGYGYSDVRTSYTQSYVNNSPFTLYYELFYSYEDMEKAEISTYVQNRYGGKVNLSYKLTPNQRINYGIEIAETNISYGPDALQSIKDYVDTYGNYFFDIIGSISWNVSLLDSGYMPKEGMSNRITMSMTTPMLSESHFYELYLKNNIYAPIGGKESGWIYNLTSQFFYGNSYDSNVEYPFYRYRYMGGISTMRGFYSQTIGPKEKNSYGDEEPVGGNTYFVFNTNLIFPIPQAPNNLRAMAFMDVGSLYNTSCVTVTEFCTNEVDFSDVRVSVGLALTYYSVIGPISLSYGVPVRKQETDESEYFQFGFGYSFD